MSERRRPKRSLLRMGFTLLLVAFSGLVVGAYPQGVWLLGASLGAVAALTQFLRVGWAAPCMIAGVYLGEFADARVKGGDIESQMWETVGAIASGAIVGLVVGLAIDLGTPRDTTDVLEGASLADAPRIPKVGPP